MTCLARACGLMFYEALVNRGRLQELPQPQDATPYDLNSRMAPVTT